MIEQAKATDWTALTQVGPVRNPVLRDAYRRMKVQEGQKGREAPGTGTEYTARRWGAGSSVAEGMCQNPIVDISHRAINWVSSRAPTLLGLLAFPEGRQHGQ